MSLKQFLATTEGTVLFLMLAALAIAAGFSIIKWNAIASAGLVLGFVVIAQEVLSAYFTSPSDDPWQIRLVLLAVVGYISLFGLSLYLWNENISGTLTGGFVLFLTRLVRGCFAPAPGNGGISPATQSQPPVAGELKP